MALKSSKSIITKDYESDWILREIILIMSISKRIADFVNIKSS